MKLLITGATGFVGRYTVAAALARGHQVRAVVRPSGTNPFVPGRPPASGSPAAGDSLETARVDLRSRAGLGDAVAGCDSVIHLAAAKSGDFYTQFAGTVAATENLLAAMSDTGVTQLVGVSTFSVYDYRSLATGSLVTETTPIDTEPARRDEYARTKLLQEELYRGFRDQPGHRCVIVRPGLIYGRDNLWHALLGAELGPRFLRVGSGATLPLLYVEHCAEALVLAAERLVDVAGDLDGEVVNLVDDDLPTQARYVELVSRVMEPPPSILVPWPVMRAASGLLERVNDTVLDGRAKFPGIVVPDRLHARFKPLAYTNAKAKRLLGWRPRLNTAEAVARSARPVDAGGADDLDALVASARSLAADGAPAGGGDG